MENGAITETDSCTSQDPSLNAIGWYCGNNGATSGDPDFGTKVIGQKIANAWGLYDMHRNKSMKENITDRSHSAPLAGKNENMPYDPG